MKIVEKMQIYEIRYWIEETPDEFIFHSQHADGNNVKCGFPTLASARATMYMKALQYCNGCGVPIHSTRQDRFFIDKKNKWLTGALHD
jgi:hypothetical protein